MSKNIFVIGIMLLFIILAVTPSIYGYNISTYDKKEKTEDYNSDRHLYPEYFDCYNADEIFDYRPGYDSESEINYVNVDSENVEEPAKQSEGPIDSPWPMYCHDTRHTGRSLYSTADNSSSESTFKVF